MNNKRTVRLILTVLFSATIILATGSAYAKKQEPKKNTAKESGQINSDQGAIISNITALRNQETRVAVLQQFLGEESNKLLQMQAVFCDQYKLNIEKFRAGKYQYSTEERKFTTND